MAKKKTTTKKTEIVKQSLADISTEYFERYPNVNELFATESGTFFFKENDAKRNANGGKVNKFKRTK